MDTQLDILAAILYHPNPSIKAKIGAWLKLSHGRPIILALNHFYECYL